MGLVSRVGRLSPEHESVGVTTAYSGTDLLRDNDGTRTRYFFHGLTEEVVKESVAGAHSDDAFIFVEKEDGESASEWAVIYPYPSGATVTSVTDTAHHPDGTSKVIKCHGGNGNVFGIGDNDAGSWNPNDAAWNSTKRVLSFWYEGGFGPLYVGVTTSAGSKELHYYATSGTDYVDGNGNVKIYLGTSAAGTSWIRLERNIEADWEGVATGVSWVNTDGVAVKPTSTLSYDFWFDDLRLSNGMTVEHNVMGPGVIGHILRHRERSSTTYAVTDRWFHYDQVGSVLSESDSTGNLAQRHDQEAFGNTLASWQTGLIGGDRPGWHHSTKEWDGDTGLVCMYQRWYSGDTGLFVAASPLPVTREDRYAFAIQEPLTRYDCTGEWDASVHWGATYLECVLAGLPRNVCSTIAGCDNGFDLSPLTEPILHSPPHFPPSLVEPMSEAQAGIWACNPCYFGRSLHRVQDFWAHVAPGRVGSHALYPNHVWQSVLGPDPDVASANPKWYDETMNYTRNLLKDYAKKCGPMQTPLDWMSRDLPSPQ